MPDLEPDSTGPAPPVAIPPIPVTPPTDASTAWHDASVFRESFLLYLTEEPLNSVLRIFGRMLFDLVLNYYHRWPDWPHGVTAAELRAAVGDLRALQGYLAGVGREHAEAPLSEPDTVLSLLAGRQAGELARVADEIELALETALAKGGA
jgi:hypothetical protein